MPTFVVIRWLQARGQHTESITHDDSCNVQQSSFCIVF